MPPKKSDNKDLREVERALEEPPPAREVAPPGVVERELLVLQDGSTLDLTSLMQKTAAMVFAMTRNQSPGASAPSLVGLGVNEGASTSARQPSVSHNASLVGLQQQEPRSNPLGLPDNGVILDLPDDESYDSNESDSEELDGESEGEDVVVGVGVNAALYRPTPSTLVRGAAPSSVAAAVGPPQPAAPLPGPQGPSLPQSSVKALDPHLPKLNEEKTNWSPNEAVLDWLHDCCEASLTSDQIKEMEKEFIPDPSRRELFSPLNLLML